MSNPSILFSRVQPVGLLAALKVKLNEFHFQWQQTMSQRREIARITQELSSCSDRQLADLGFCRTDIPDVARGSFNQA